MVLIAHQTGYRHTEFINWKLPVGSGKEFFAILVNYTRPVEDLYYTSGILEFKGEEVKNDKVFISMDRVSIINCFSSEDGNENYVFNDKVYTLDDPFDTDKLFSIMRTVRESLPENAWVVWVFFSLTDLSIGVSETEIARFFRRASRLHKQYGDLAFYLLNMDAHNPKFLAIISQLVDVIINFRMEENAEKIRNYTQVIKSPFPIDTKRLYYDIDPNGNIIYY
jgi:KaiC/GvpD/RAD55 family RecA-like ATPase